MKGVSGETKQLRVSERAQLEKLLSRRTNPRELIDLELARRAARLCAQLGQQLGLLIGRDGRITHVILGTKDRLYLPDLGRFRLDSARLRRLRLVVFTGQDQLDIKRDLGTEAKLRFGKHDHRAVIEQGRGRFLSFEVPHDLLTDLEKLRLDAVAVIAVEQDGSPGPVAVAQLSPITEADNQKSRYLKTAQPGIVLGGARDLPSLMLDFDALVRDLEVGFREFRGRGYDTGKDHAVLVGAYTSSAADARSSMDELTELARTAEIQVLDVFIQRRRELDPKTVIGKGKIEELVLHCLDLGADLLIFDRELTPGQLRSISNLTELRVIDRSMLILDIFAQRAKSSEGRLQVELAQLKYSLPRLTEKDTGLSRLTGGIGGRGPGETKLEISRRRARDRISELEKRIEKLASQRGLRRQRRQSRGVPVIAIVGYTNAGKSTLLNALTKGDTFVESKLFATLDPASKRMRFPNDREVIFVDTVGFIRELPKELVAAFRATLEEVGEADLLIHVVDAANQEMPAQIKVVEQTLASLGFDKTPCILVLNKIDLLSDPEVKTLRNSFNALAVSALDRLEFEELIQTLQEKLSRTFKGQDPGRFTEISAWPRGGSL